MSSHVRDHKGHNIHFFKVILESNIRDGKLRVPKGFVRRYWQEISNPVFLRLPNGAERKVCWTKKDGDVWFCDGWKEFAQYLSLEVSQFVVFQYEEKSSFNVIIFGKSALEIKYPDEKGEEVNNENDYSLEILDDFDQINHTRPKSPIPYAQARKKMKTNPKEEPACYSSHAETKHEKKKGHYAGFDNAKKPKKSGSSRDLDERINAFHKKVNQNFHSEKDWFTCPMKKTYTERDLLVIPINFSKTILHMKEGEATLFVTKERERSWDVMIKHYCSDRQVTFVGGWDKFFKDNNLKLGDVCAFVLNKCRGVSFKVVIFPFEDDSSLPHFEDQKGLSNRPSSSFKSPESPKANSRIMSRNHFTIDIKHNPLHFARIPVDFMRSRITLGGKYAILRVGKRTWRVKVLYYPSICSAKFSQGYSVFLKECNLKVGDSCRFEMIDEENHVLEVSILKHPLN